MGTGTCATSPDLELGEWTLTWTLDIVPAIRESNRFRYLASRQFVDELQHIILGSPGKSTEYLDGAAESETREIAFSEVRILK